MTLANRLHQSELMDALDVDANALKQALRALGFINAISLSSQIVWPTLRELARSTPQRPLRVLDVGCGGGDIIRRLDRQARRARLDIEWHGFDRSPVAVQMAQEMASRGSISAKFEVRDVVQDALPDDFDVVMCSLFLHHLSEQDAIGMLRKMSGAARRTVLTNDLRRTNWGYIFSWLGCRLLTRSHIVHVDGPRSVAGAFTEKEVLGLAACAGWTNSRLSRHWPQRFLLRWDRQ